MSKRKIVVETKLPIDEVEKRWTDNVKYKKFNYRWLIYRPLDKNKAIGNLKLVNEFEGNFWLDYNNKKNYSLIAWFDVFRHAFRGRVTVVKDFDSEKVVFEGKVSQHWLEKGFLVFCFTIFAITCLWVLYQGWWLESLFTFMFPCFGVVAWFQLICQNYNKLDNDMLKFLTELLDGEVMEYHKQIGSFEWEDLGRKKTK